MSFFIRAVAIDPVSYGGCVSIWIPQGSTLLEIIEKGTSGPLGIFLCPLEAPEVQRTFVYTRNNQAFDPSLLYVGTFFSEILNDRIFILERP